MSDIRSFSEKPPASPEDIAREAAGLTGLLDGGDPCLCARRLSALRALYRERPQWFDAETLAVLKEVSAALRSPEEVMRTVFGYHSFRPGQKEIMEAVLAGSARRLRPILLTSLTTFFGLAPMILETSVQARFLIPMAVSLGFGVLAGTFIMLLLVPCGYLILEDTRRTIDNSLARLRGNPTLPPPPPVQSDAELFPTGQ